MSPFYAGFSGVGLTPSKKGAAPTLYPISSGLLMTLDADRKRAFCTPVSISRFVMGKKAELSVTLLLSNGTDCDKFISSYLFLSTLRLSRVRVKEKEILFVPSPRQDKKLICDHMKCIDKYSWYFQVYKKSYFLLARREKVFSFSQSVGRFSPPIVRSFFLRRRKFVILSS